MATPMGLSLKPTISAVAALARSITAGGSAVQVLLAKAWPLDRPTRHWPLTMSWPSTSCLPSPLTSPVRTPLHVAADDQVSQWLVLNAKPTDVLTHHSPVL